MYDDYDDGGGCFSEPCELCECCGQFYPTYKVQKVRYTEEYDIALYAYMCNSCLFTYED